MPSILLAATLLGPACKEAPQPVEMEIDYVPVSAKQLEAVDAKTAKDVHQALDTLLNEPAEQASAADLAAARDPGKLVGTWQIAHTIYSTNGEASQPTPPIVPTTWTIGKDGTLAISGGMKIDAQYVYTGEQLLITGFGPKQTYEVRKLTDDALEVTAVVEAGTTRIENTTVLKRR